MHFHRRKATLDSLIMAIPVPYNPVLDFTGVFSTRRGVPGDLLLDCCACSGRSPVAAYWCG